MTVVNGAAAVLDPHPFFTAVVRLAARRDITADEAQWRLEYVAESLGIPGITLAELMLDDEDSAGA
jgi:hypothetical protein